MKTNNGDNSNDKKPKNNLAPRDKNKKDAHLIVNPISQQPVTEGGKDIAPVNDNKKDNIILDDSNADSKQITNTDTNLTNI